MTLEQDCVAVLAKELGPATKAFLDRQCRHHLKKEPSALQKSDLDELARWCQIGTQLTLGTETGEIIKKGILSLK
jgi:hypothetical protein